MKPASWSKYRKLLDRGATEVHPDLNIFAARYAMAKALPEFSFNDFSSATSDGYYVALKLSLAYTAFESLESAINENKRLKILSKEIAIELRNKSNASLLTSIVNHKNVDQSLKRKLIGFINQDDDDLRYFIYCVRNLMFHGSLTSNLLKLNQSKKRRKMLRDLSELTLEVADTRFTKYVSNIKL